MDQQYLQTLEEQQLDLARQIRERELNITKIEKLKQATIRGDLDVSKYENLTVNQFLKTKESQMDQVNGDAITAIIIGGSILILIFIAALCYWMRKQRLEKSSAVVKMTDFENVTPH